MTKRYLGKNINMFLLIIIIISVGSLVGISTYYNQRYQSISNGYKEKEDQLENISEELISTKNELLQLRGQFNQTSTDVEKYDSLYSEKVSELGDLNSQLSKAVKDYEKVKKDLVGKTNELKTEQDTTKALRIEINDYKDDLNSCKSDLSDCDDELEDCTG